MTLDNSLDFGGLYRGLGDTGHLPFHCKGYGILSILLQWTWGIVFSICVDFHGIHVLMGYLSVYLKGI